MKTFLAWPAVAAVLLCTGCPPPPITQPAPPEQPPRTLDEIVATIEANAAKLNQALWSNSVTVTARFTDKHGKEHVYNLDSNLLFRPPRGLRMDLRPSMGEQVMQIGSNDADYWVWIEPELRTMWWGRYVHVGKSCTETIAVRPDQLVAALGLGGLPNGEEGLIGPVRKYGRTFDILYYMRGEPSAVSRQLSAISRQPSAKGEPGREGDTQDSALRTQHSYSLDREYWVDRVPPYLVRVVEFRDVLGRVTTSAFLDDYRAAWEGGPLVPHAVSIIWHQDNGKFTMTIGRVQGLPAEKVTADKFRRPARDQVPAGVTDIIQVDADCDVVYVRGRNEPPGEGSEQEAQSPAGSSEHGQVGKRATGVTPSGGAPLTETASHRIPPGPLPSSSVWVSPEAAGPTSWVPRPSLERSDWLTRQPWSGVPRGWAGPARE